MSLKFCSLSKSPNNRCSSLVDQTYDTGAKRNGRIHAGATPYNGIRRGSRVNRESHEGMKVSPRKRTKRLTGWKPNERGESSSSLPSLALFALLCPKFPIWQRRTRFLPRLINTKNPVAIEMLSKRGKL